MHRCVNPKCKWHGELTPERTGLDQMNRPVCGMCRTMAAKVEPAATMEGMVGRTALGLVSNEQLASRPPGDPIPETATYDDGINGPVSVAVQPGESLGDVVRRTTEGEIDPSTIEDYDHGPGEDDAPKPKKRGSSGRFAPKE